MAEVPDIRLKRVYEPETGSDGVRILVDRLWPRGLAKAELKLDAWMKDVAPSTDLRKWFGHDPAKWTEFRRRYAEELDANPAAVEALRDKIGRGPATLLYGAKDETHNQAVALKDYLARRR